MMRDRLGQWSVVGFAAVVGVYGLSLRMPSGADREPRSELPVPSPSIRADLTRPAPSAARDVTPSSPALEALEAPQIEDLVCY